MTCDECDKIQKLAFNKNINDTSPIYYYRVGNSNVAIVCCPKHAKEIISKLNEKKHETKNRN
ncbi:MAG: hypothetical protein AABY22_27910 [Nanoarchaeota archaeon]